MTFINLYSFDRQWDQDFNFSISSESTTPCTSEISFLSFFLFNFFLKESELRPRTNLTMSSDRGPATPVGIGVSGTSGVNIVIKSPCLFAFLLAWVRPPWGSFLQGARSEYCVLKAPLFKKLFIFLSLRQHFGRLWGQSGELLGPGRHNRRRWQSP